MKTLVTISFSLDLDDNRLASFASDIDKGLREGFLASLSAHPGIDGNVLDEHIEYYGAAISVKHPLGEVLA